MAGTAAERKPEPTRAEPGLVPVLVQSSLEAISVAPVLTPVSVPLEAAVAVVRFR